MSTVENYVKGVLACLGALLGAIGSVIYLMPEEQLLPLFLAILMAYVFLDQPRSSVRFRWINWVLACLSLAVGGYAAVKYESFVIQLGLATGNDVLAGVVASALVLEGARRTAGPALTILVLVFLLYALFGPYLPSVIAHKGYSLARLMGQMYVGRQGMFGLPLSVLVRYVMLFVLFGSLLEASGGASFLINLARALAGRLTGGIGLVAVVSSSLMGTISGSAVANVVTTGTLTIPTMKRSGYEPHIAAAIEAVASTGGQLMPPVMGAAAFLMADVLGIPYVKVCAAALIPALLYYLSTGSAVYFYAARRGLVGESKASLPSLGKVLREQGHFALPLVIIVLLLVVGYSPVTSGLWGVVAAYAVGLIKKDSRLGPGKLVQVFRNAGSSMATLAVASAAAGMVVGVVQLTGIGARFSGVLVDLAGGQLLPLLVLTMIVNIIMGMGMPTTVVYVVLATLIVPGLTGLGVEPIVAHLFVFYYGILSMITPPVAMAAYAAAGLAKCSASRTGWAAFLIGLPVFLVPYFFVYNPALAMVGSPASILRSAVAAGLGVVVFASGTTGFLIRPLNWLQRVLAIIAGVALIDEALITDLVGLGLFVAILVHQLYTAGRPRLPA